MKRKNFAIGIVSFFMIGMVFGTFSINSAKAQGIVNGGFETGDFTGWDIWTSSTYPAEFSITNDSHSGYYAAKGSIDLSGECGSMEQRFNVSQNVALSFYYKANMQSGPNIDYGGYRLLSGWSLYDETQNTQITQGYFDKKENYTNVWFDLSAYHGHIMKLRVYIGSDGVNGIPIDYKAFIDDVDILVDNLPPVADAEPDHQVVYVEEEVWFSGNGSYDPDGHIVCYHWDFGDGTTGSGMIVSHIYYSIGNFNVTLTVTDNDGLTDEDTCTVSVRNQTPPPPPPPPSNDDWPMFNHDPEHTGFSTSTAPDNSSLLWTFTGSWPMTSPSVSHGLVFVACGWSSLTALNASTGETIWTYDFWGWPSQPVLANQRVFVSTLEFQNTSDEVHVYCLNEFLGDLIWEWNSSELNWPSSPPLFLEGPPLTIANNHIYLGLSAIPDPGGQGGSMIICLDETTGDLIWSVNLADLGLDYMHVPLTVANNMIFGCSANQLFALDESNGDLLWTFYNNRPAWFESAPAVLNGKLFIGCDNTHMFYCLNANSGSIIWQTSLGANYSFTAPALAYSKVFVGANEVITQNDTTEYVDPIFALDQDTGEVLWRYDISTAVVSSPAVADNKVFNSFYDGRICALDAATGSVIWTFPTRSSSWYLHQSLAIAYGNLYASMGYTLIAFGPGGTINIPPHAEAEPPIQTTYVGGEAWFSGHRSYDPDGHIVSYHWDFGDGTFGNGVYTTHNYTMPGIYNVTLTVTDDEGATDSDEVMVIVEEEGPPVNRPPVADAEPDHQVIYAGEEAWFTGNRSYDPDGYIVSYHWYFGDGTNGSGVTVTHIYNIPGNYTVMLTVTDDDGDSDSDFVTVTVLGEPPENFPPVAMAEPPIQMVYVGEEAWFSGNYSYDPDGYIVAYRWDFGDGTFGRGIWVTHIYNMTGIYEVTLTVVDNDGATDSYQVLVIVEEEGPPQNQPPVAMAEPPIQMINVGDEAWFSGNCSYDPDGYIVSYHWDFGDGTSGNGEWVTHTYNYPGNYTVTLTVTDDDGATDSDFVTVTVLGEPPQNQPPVAMAEPPIQMIYVGEEAWFSGNCSYDPDGYIVSYHWDFGDGTSGNGEWVTHIYNYPGNYTVTLTVTDDDGATDSHEVIVIVEEGDPPPENLPPVAMAEPPVQIVYVGEEAWFSGNCSYDPDGYIVTYHWNFGDGISKGGVTVKHVYHYPGNYTVSLTVTDDDGATDCDTVMVIVRKLQEDNWSPVADAGSDRFAHPYEELIFNGNGSFDLDGTIVSYEWDFGDGFTAKGMMVTHSYSEHRTYIVTLFVVDDEGATDTETCIVFVTNMLPIVYIEEESETYFMGEQVQFAGNSSYDPDGYIVSYEWDFGDGSYHSGITASHIFTSPGAFCVTLTVCDNNDGTNKNSVIIEISEKENNPWQPPEPEIPAPWPKKVRNPVLILTAGLINIATFNEESERVVPVEVAAYYGDVHNVHIELIDDGGLDIEIIPIVQDVPDGKIVRFYLVIKDPESSDEVESKGITIKLKAVGDETESNLEYVDVIIIDKIKENPMISEVEVVSAAGTLTIASILAILIKRRIF